MCLKRVDSLGPFESELIGWKIVCKPFDNSYQTLYYHTTFLMNVPTQSYTAGDVFVDPISRVASGYPLGYPLGFHVYTSKAQVFEEFTKFHTFYTTWRNAKIVRVLLKEITAKGVEFTNMIDLKLDVAVGRNITLLAEEECCIEEIEQTGCAHAIADPALQQF